MFEDAENPFNGQAGGFAGDCEFPQITREGLDDAWQHGKDLYEVYHEKLQLIPISKKGEVPKGEQGFLHFIDVYDQVLLLYSSLSEFLSQQKT